MPKVLITGFCHLPGTNRVGVQLQHVLRALSAKHSVDVLVVRKGDQAYVERQGSARILRVPISEDNVHDQIEAFRRALRRQIEGADYDIVHFRDGWAGTPVLEMRERLGHATVFDAARGPMAEASLADIDLEAELERDEETCILAADAVLVATEHAHSFVTRLRPDRVYVVPPGVDVDQFDWESPTEGGRPVVLYAGSVEPGRGVRVLLRAMVEVAAKSDAQLVIAGDPPPGFAAHLARAVDDLELTGRVDLLGGIPHEDMAPLIAQATVCVAPAAAELTARPAAIYPTKLLEYMACRRAVVAPRRGTVNLLLRGGREGLLFAPGDPVDLAAKILRLLGDAPLRQRLAHAGYEMVRKAQTASATRRALKHAYTELLARAKLPTRSDVALPAIRPSGAGMEGTDEMYSPDLDGAPGDITAVENAALGPGGGRAVTTADDVEPIDDELAELAVEETRESVPTEEADVGDSGAWTVISTPVGLDDEGTVLSDSPPVPPPSPSPAAGADDGWIVAERRMFSRAETWSQERFLDDDGTPLDVAPVSPADSPLTENRFVAGEFEVPDPGGPSRPGGDAMPELSDETAFTAVSVLLGSEDTDPRKPVPPLADRDTAPRIPVARPGTDPGNSTPSVEVGDVEPTLSNESPPDDGRR